MTNGSVPRTLADEIRASAQDGTIVELVSGAIAKRGAPGTRHENIVARIHEKLSTHVDAHDLGAVFRLPWPLELSKFDVVRPDVFFTSLESGVVGVDGFMGRPELVVEVISPETRERDLGEKKRLYQWAGVLEYWIVDPESRTIQGYVKGKNKFEPIPAGDSVFRSNLLPGFELDLSCLFNGQR